MKKLILIMGILLLACPAFAGKMTPVLSSTQVVYSPVANVWSTGSMVEDRIVLSKKTSPGTGNYSIYSYSNGDEAFMLGSDYEFIFEGRLIACHNADLKIFEVVYNGKNFEEKELTQGQIKQIFPNAEIILISHFIDNKITVRKSPFKKRDFLLLNDTDKNFHKYSFHPQSVKFSPVAGLFRASAIGKITFSHFGEDKYIIYVKNVYKKIQLLESSYLEE